MKCCVMNQSLSGSVIVPASKSLSHRAILAAALSKGESIIENLVFSEDILATLDAVEALGVSVFKRKNKVHIVGSGELRTPTAPIHCRESGSTLRFLIPFAGLLEEPLVFTGAGKLMERPLEPYWHIFNEQGIRYHHEPHRALMIDGKLKSGVFKLSGNVSSQFISGLLFVLPLLKGDSEIRLLGQLESRDYVQLTIDVLKAFGINVRWQSENCIAIQGDQSYKNTHYSVEADYSQSAFWIAAGLMGEELKLSNMNPNSAQGDRRILEITKNMGADLQWLDQELLVRPTKTQGAVIDASQCPDLVPIVATLAAVSKGRTEIVNAGRLRIKESDRLKAIATELSKLGAYIEENPEGLVIEGVEVLSGGNVEGWNDHRIVMSLAIAALKSSKPIYIEGAESVHKSYPHFFEDFKRLGGMVR